MNKQPEASYGLHKAVFSVYIRSAHNLFLQCPWQQKHEAIQLVFPYAFKALFLRKEL
jgi:hypothetical protein